MKKLFALILLAGCLLAVAPSAIRAADNTPTAYVIKLHGEIGPATYDLVRRNLNRAADDKADVVVIEIDTPGGLYDSMQQIIQRIIDSPVPVVTFVSPSGAHAASAGTYILYASHIAAMAPGTNIGAATPIRMDQMYHLTEKNDPSMPADKQPLNTLGQKMVSDAAAYIRGLAEMRGRNAEWAEKAVRSADSMTASEALSAKVIDVIASDTPRLLEKIDGREVEMKDGVKRTLKTHGAKIESFDEDWRTNLLNVITNPNIAFLLMTIGTYGLIYEVSHPGVLFPGVIGGICLLLGLFATNVLPISYTGLGLLLGGLVLMGAEAIVPSFGVLGIGGVISFVAGALLLIDSKVPGFGIDLSLIITMAAVSVGVLTVLLTIVLRAQRKPKTTGIDELIASTCTVLTWSGGKGEVRVTGEIWQAAAAGEFIFSPGDTARILAVDGLRLIITPIKS